MNSFNYKEMASQYDDEVKEYDSFGQMYIFHQKNNIGGAKYYEKK